MTLASLLPFLLIAAAVLALVAWRGRRFACWLLGHEVGVARVEPPRIVQGDPPVRIRTSRCVHCNRAFTDGSEHSEAA